MSEKCKKIAPCADFHAAKIRLSARNAKFSDRQSGFPTQKSGPTPQGPAKDAGQDVNEPKRKSAGLANLLASPVQM